MPKAILPLPTNTTTRNRPVVLAKTASEALVLPVDAQAAVLAPTIRACVAAAVMPLSLKLPGGIQPLVLQKQATRVHADVAADAVGRLQNRLPLADGDDFLGRGERQQLAEPPDAAHVERVAAIGPAGLEVAERRGHGNAVPVVADVEQAATGVAGDADLVDGVVPAAVRGDADLAGKLGKVGFSGNQEIP